MSAALTPIDASPINLGRAESVTRGREAVCTRLIPSRLARARVAVSFHLKPHTSALHPAEDRSRLNRTSIDYNVGRAARAARESLLCQYHFVLRSLPDRVSQRSVACTRWLLLKLCRMWLDALMLGSIIVLYSSWFQLGYQTEKLYTKVLMVSTE
jgi:hypothetical protein